LQGKKEIEPINSHLNCLTDLVLWPSEGLQAFSKVALSEEILDDLDNLFEGLEPFFELFEDLVLGLAQLLVKALSVRTSLHCHLEDWSNQHVVVLGQGLTIGLSERSSQFFRWVIKISSHGRSSKIQTSGQPQQPLSSILLLTTSLTQHNGLKTLSLRWVLQLLSSDFLHRSISIFSSNFIDSPLKLVYLRVRSQPLMSASRGTRL
jgi:hypothetical protein